MIKNKKANAMSGALMTGITAVLLLFIVGFILSIGAYLIQDLHDPVASQQANNSLFNITSDSLVGFDKVSGFQTTIGLIIAAIIIISILMGMIALVIGGLKMRGGY